MEENEKLEEVFRDKFKEVYTAGLKVGMKTMCGLLLEEIEKTKNLNPQKRIALLKEKLNHHLGIVNEEENK